MFGKFLPKETSFFDFFEQHAALIVQAAEMLFVLLSTGTHIATKADQIKSLEHEADRVTYQCIEALRQTFITPFEREEIYHLISTMDDVIDYIEETAARIALYHIEEMKLEGQELAHILVLASQELEEALRGLRKLEGVEVNKKIFQNVYTLENQADVILRTAVGKLFEEEIDLRNLIKWKEIYENIENAIDCSQDVANIIEGVVLEYG